MAFAITCHHRHRMQGPLHRRAVHPLCRLIRDDRTAFAISCHLWWRMLVPMHPRTDRPLREDWSPIDFAWPLHSSIHARDPSLTVCCQLSVCQIDIGIGKIHGDSNPHVILWKLHVILWEDLRGVFSAEFSSSTVNRRTKRRCASGPSLFTLSPVQATTP